MKKFIAIAVVYLITITGFAFGEAQVLISEIPDGFWPAVFMPGDVPGFKSCHQGETIFFPICFSMKSRSESAPFQPSQITFSYKGGGGIENSWIIYPSGETSGVNFSINKDSFNLYLLDKFFVQSGSVVTAFIGISFAGNAAVGNHELRIQKAEFIACHGGKVYSDNQDQRWFQIYVKEQRKILQASACEEPAKFVSLANHPNPFNPSTTINFSLAKAGEITVEVFNISGQKVTTLARGYRKAGRHSIVWNAESFSAGTYICVLRLEEIIQTKKMVLLK